MFARRAARPTCPCHLRPCQPEPWSLKAAATLAKNRQAIVKGVRQSDEPLSLPFRRQRRNLTATPVPLARRLQRLGPSGPSRASIRPGWVPDHVMDEQPVPDEKDDERTDRRTDESGALIEPVPTDGLTEESGQEGARNAKHRGQDEACRVVRPRREEPCDETGDEADHDHPNDVPHQNLRIECATSWLAVQRSELRRIERVAALEPSRFQARHDSARAL